MRDHLKHSLWHKLLALLVMLAAGCFPVAHGQDKQKPGSAEKIQPPPAFAVKGLQVISHELDPATGLRVWAVHHPVTNERAIIYSLPGNKVIFSGALWDGVTGANISDKYYAALAASQPAQAGAVPSAGAGEIPAPIQTLSKLTGVRKGGKDVPMQRTLFVFFDPRCPHCKSFYEQTKDRADLKNRAVVWIPVPVLGDPVRGNAMIAEILQAKNKEEALQVSFMGLSTGKVEPNADTLKVINENLATFRLAFQSSPNAGPPSVPVAFFMDKHGSPQMVPNPSAVLPKITAEMN